MRIWHSDGGWGLATLEKPTIQETGLGEEGDIHGHEQEGSPLPLERVREGFLRKETLC